jgi:hypothetical protein
VTRIFLEGMRRSSECGMFVALDFLFLYTAIVNSFSYYILIPLLRPDIKLPQAAVAHIPDGLQIVTSSCLGVSQGAGDGIIVQGDLAS